MAIDVFEDHSCLTPCPHAGHSNVKASIADSLYASVVLHIEALLKDTDAKRAGKGDDEIRRYEFWQFGDGIRLLPPGGNISPLFITVIREPSLNGDFQIT
jgi:hypothetical protein